MRFFKVLFTPISKHPTCGESLFIVVAILVLLSLIPGPQCALKYPPATRALADISGIETALTEILADVQLSRLEQLFNPDGVREVAMRDFGATAWPPLNAADFQAATTVYTRTLYAILRAGRNAIGATDPLGYEYGKVLKEEFVTKLGDRYLEIGNDPFGNLYNIYPGPWDAKGKEGSLLTIPFRIYKMQGFERYWMGASASPKPDVLSIHIDGDEQYDRDEWYDFTLGYPAATNEIAFIWSNGINLVSSQALYSAAGYKNVEKYDLNQDPDSFGGGDDINNWDPANSWRLFY